MSQCLSRLVVLLGYIHLLIQSEAMALQSFTERGQLRALQTLSEGVQCHSACQGLSSFWATFTLRLRARLWPYNCTLSVDS